MISTIIPVLNEASGIERLLAHLLKNVSNKFDNEIVIVDGGSSDETCEIVKRFCHKNSSAHIKLIHSLKGRAKQMNAGAQHATSDILYFLHADSFPPKNFDLLIEREVKKDNSAGCFKMKFDNNHWWLQLAGWLTRFNWRACRGGDQSQFITRTLFDEIGGYDESYIIYEDNILLNELYARNKFVVIPHEIISSARLYETRGVWYVQYHFWSIYVKKWLGADADELFDYYVKHIKLHREATAPIVNEPSKVLADN